MVTFRFNPASGELRRMSRDTVEDLRQQVAELEQEVRRWRFNAGHWESVAHTTQANMGRHHREDKDTLARVWGLVDHRRKTLRMEDLWAILRPGG